MAEKPVSHPGGFFRHLTDLAAAVKAGDYGVAFGLFAELLQMVADDVANVPSVVPVFGATADPVAALEQFVADNKPTAGTFAAIPWGQLWQTLGPILVDLLAKMLKK